jgi:hypothetical protein
MKQRTLVVVVGLAAAVVGGLLVGVGLLGWSVGASARTPALLREDCETDLTVSGFQGWCVQARQTDRLFSEPQTWVYIVAVHDGQKLPRVTYAPFPFNDVDGYQVTFGAHEITLTDEQGIVVTYPESYYALG